MAADALGTAESVAQAIRNGIKTGQFVPGQHLVEVALTQRLEISRSSLREALRNLHGDGIVSMNRYRGSHICRLTRKEAADLLEVLEQLVCLAARRAALFEGDKVSLMEAAVTASDHQVIRDRQAYLGLRQAFYDTLFAISANHELPRVAPLGRADLFRAQIRPYQAADDQLSHADGYRTIADAVISGEAVLAEQSVRSHFSGTHAMIARLPDEAFASD